MHLSSNAIDLNNCSIKCKSTCKARVSEKRDQKQPKKKKNYKPFVAASFSSPHSVRQPKWILHPGHVRTGRVLNIIEPHTLSRHSYSVSGRNEKKIRAAVQSDIGGSINSQVPNPIGISQRTATVASAHTKDCH